VIAGRPDSIEGDVTRCLGAGGGLSPRDPAPRLGRPEPLAVSSITLLAATGRPTIERVLLPSAAALARSHRHGGCRQPESEER
jgi:hypothetical protein